MPQDPAAAALAAALRTVSIDDHDEILKAAKAVLEIDKANEQAQHTRVVALLKLDRFEDAFLAISEGGVKLESTCALEKAYALYKLGKLDEAAATLNSTGLHNRGLSHIAAQVAYRAERFDESLSIYNQLLGSEYHQEDHDIKINIQAAQAQALWKDTPATDEVKTQQGFESFEMCYNAASASIAQGSFNVALELLQRALTLCDASEELNSAEKEEERKPILAQQAFALAKLGDLDRAREIHGLLKLETNPDPDLRIIGQNNQLIVEDMPQNPFLLERQAGTWLSSGTEARLFNFQSHILARNSSIISLLSHKPGGVKKRAYGVADQPRPTISRSEMNNMSVIGAAAGTHGIPEKDVLKSLISLSKRRSHDAGLTLIIVQLHLQRRNLGAAVYTLDSFFSRLEISANEQCRRIRFSPGLVALAVVLKRIQKRERSAKAELIEAARYWHSRPAHPALSLLKEAGVELVSSSSNNDIRLAGAIFEKLSGENVASPATSAGLVAALAAANTSEVAHHAASLPSTDSLVHGIKVDQLLNSGILVSSSRCFTSKKRPSSKDNNVERATKKRRRKLPKNLLEGQAPDPERWLPLRDRSSYRPKGKKGRKKAADSTQGGLVKEEETIGLVGGGGVKVEKAAVISASKKKKKKTKK
ncbi:hypothetical protein E4U41_007534 [Claviceps citrina]|nr:hypothetical protein E4U41_007534 [Claviceps citrina]